MLASSCDGKNEASYVVIYADEATESSEQHHHHHHPVAQNETVSTSAASGAGRRRKAIPSRTPSAERELFVGGLIAKKGRGRATVNNIPAGATTLEDRNEFQECPYCGCRYKGKSSFTTHLRKKHPDKHRELVCYVCNSTVDEMAFTRHFRIHQAQDARQSQGETRLLQCDFCEFRCHLNVDLIQHMGLEHDGNNAFSIARTEAQFLMKNRRHRNHQSGTGGTLAKHTRMMSFSVEDYHEGSTLDVAHRVMGRTRSSDNDSESTLSGVEAPDMTGMILEVETHDVLIETGPRLVAAHEDHHAVVETSDSFNDMGHISDDLLSCLKRGQNELLSQGFTHVQLHHLNISAYERSWIKLLVAQASSASAGRLVRIPIDRASLAPTDDQLTNFVIENEVPVSLRKLFEADAWHHLQEQVLMKRDRFTCCVCRGAQNLKVSECGSCGRRYHQSCGAQVATQADYSCAACLH